MYTPTGITLERPPPSALLHRPLLPPLLPRSGPYAAAAHSQRLQVGPLDRRRQRRELGGGRVPARHSATIRAVSAHRYAPPLRLRGAQAATDRAAPPLCAAQHRARARLARTAARDRSSHAAAATGGTHRVSKSLHWPSDSGSAFTFVAEMDLPRIACACGRARCAHGELC